MPQGGTPISHGCPGASAAKSRLQVRERVLWPSSGAAGGPMPGGVGPALVPQEAKDKGKRNPCELLSSLLGL